MNRRQLSHKFTELINTLQEYEVLSHNEYRFLLTLRDNLLLKTPPDSQRQRASISENEAIEEFSHLVSNLDKSYERQLLSSRKMKLAKAGWLILTAFAFLFFIFPGFLLLKKFKTDTEGHASGPFSYAEYRVQKPFREFHRALDQLTTKTTNIPERLHKPPTEAPSQEKQFVPETAPPPPREIPTEEQIVTLASDLAALLQTAKRCQVLTEEIVNQILDKLNLLEEAINAFPNENKRKFWIDGLAQQKEHFHSLLLKKTEPPLSSTPQVKR